ncbi:hypothetical protein Tco_1340186 [Tanacetum coccineum]
MIMMFRPPSQRGALQLWYPRDSPFDLEAFSDSDYGGSNLDRKSTTGGCQLLGKDFSNLFYGCGKTITSPWNGYLRKGRKTKPKRQNQTRNGKASQPKSKKRSGAKSQQSKSKPTMKNT